MSAMARMYGTGGMYSASREMIVERLLMQSTIGSGLSSLTASYTASRQLMIASSISITEMI